MTLPKHDAFISHNPHTHTHRHTHLLYLTCHDYSIGWMKETKDNNEETRRKRFMKVISNADYLPARPFFALDAYLLLPQHTLPNIPRDTSPYGIVTSARVEKGQNKKEKRKQHQ